MSLDVFFHSIKQLPTDSRIYNLTGSSCALFLALMEKPFIMVESTEEAARELHRDIQFYLFILNSSNTKEKIRFLPAPDGPDISGQRAGFVYEIANEDSIITSLDSANAQCWKLADLKKQIVFLRNNLEMSRDVFEQKLISLGYKQASLVAEHGEISRRGWLFDVFPSTADDPVRIEFFGDAVDSIRSFDVETQKSIAEIKEFTLLPAKEPDEGCSVFEFPGRRTVFYSDAVRAQSGIHHAEKLPEGSIELSRFSFPENGIDSGILSIAGLGIYHSERKSLYDLSASLRTIIKEHTVLIVSSSKGQAERIKDILMSSSGDEGIIAPVIPKTELNEYAGRIAITVGELSAGFFMPGLLILTEKEIFAEKPAFRPIRKSKVARLLTSLDNLAINDYIVHKDHGIARFTGLIKQKMDEYEGDLMVLEYAGGDRLYLPLYGIDRLSKYHAEEGVIPGLDRLGGKSWLRTREKVRKKIQEMAEKLVKLYAEREISKGFVFSSDSELHKEFDDFFIYEETPDQIQAIQEIKADMESANDPHGQKRPMDRLLCGDVGYGKTEVAMRAAFKAVYDGKQVAVLVPTTILCEQHHHTFIQRFSAFPVAIDFLSRFKSPAEQKKTIKKIMSGEIDILIGTHGLLKKGIEFHSLGLLVIDEEHRFGVAQKEKLKELRKGVDVLTLSATPIPRTLNMALSGIRSMSMIETPPEERLSVKTVVATFDKHVIGNAIIRELERAGQVYIVHNRIHDIEKFLHQIQKIAPKARIAVAHGRMPKHGLERIMHKFVNREIDILVSTAIIGAGLDIPNANTIIIDRADRMGLADLYQLRGRVGRSNVKAYAYFLIPGPDIITDEAKKRLQGVQDMSYLGAGFRLAMKDLEIRGAGNLLGPEQSGNIHSVGFDLYVEMLEKAVAELRGFHIEEEIEPRISMRISAFISEEFIMDITLRLSIYRRIASASSEKELDVLMDELKDRFGSLPLEVRNLCDVMKLKILAKSLRITHIEESGGNIRIGFSKDTHVAVEKILGLNDTMKGRIRFLEQGFDILRVRDLPWNEVFSVTKEVLEKLL